jgi:hypothetical protein
MYWLEKHFLKILFYNYPLLLTILFTSVFEVSVIFFMKGEFLTFSKPLKTLARKFDHPIPNIANTITIIKNIAIRALNSDNIYQTYYKNTFCLAF